MQISQRQLHRWTRNACSEEFLALARQPETVDWITRIWQSPVSCTILRKTLTSLASSSIDLFDFVVLPQFDGIMAKFEAEDHHDPSNLTVSYSKSINDNGSHKMSSLSLFHNQRFLPLLLPFGQIARAPLSLSLLVGLPFSWFGSGLASSEPEPWLLLSLVHRRLGRFLPLRLVCTWFHSRRFLLLVPQSTIPSSAIPYRAAEVDKVVMEEEYIHEIGEEEKEKLNADVDYPRHTAKKGKAPKTAMNLFSHIPEATNR